MNKNETRTLWISVFSALFAVFLLYSYTQEKSDQLTKKFGAKEQVVVAKRDIAEMETIDETMLELTEKPLDFIEPKAINDPELAVGKVALAPIREKEQILESKIVKPSTVTGLALQITPGKRAVSIPIDEMRGVAKLIKPGDRIDILVALDVGKATDKKKEIKTILSDVIILATGLKISNELPRLFEDSGGDDFVITNLKGDTSFTTVTIEVSPKEAQKVVYILATSPGSLFLTLRHPSDHIRNNTLRRATLDSILGKVDSSLIKKQVRRPSAVARPLASRVKPKKKKKKKRSGAFRNIN